MIITLLRKPLEGTVADNVLKHGCGGINIDASRVSFEGSESIDFNAKQRQQADPKEKGWSGHVAQVGSEIQMYKEKGRFPANLVLIHKEGCELQGTKKIKPNGSGTASKKSCVNDCPVKSLDEQSGILKSGAMDSIAKGGQYTTFGQMYERRVQNPASEGGASRFFKQFNTGYEIVDYFKLMITPPIEDPIVLVTPPNDFITDRESVHGLILLGEPTKTQAKEILTGLKSGAHIVMIPEKDSIGYKGTIALEDLGFEVRDSIFVADGTSDIFYGSKASRSEREAGLEVKESSRSNIHPTVKPIEVMEWCGRDIAPNSKVVDPFLGSGTTGVAMSRLGHDFVGIELNPEYAEICEARIRYWMPIGTEMESEAQVSTTQADEGQISLFDS